MSSNTSFVVLLVEKTEEKVKGLNFSNVRTCQLVPFQTGCDGKRYPYLFKGLEDLHLDERIMQFLAVSLFCFRYDAYLGSSGQLSNHQPNNIDICFI